MPKYPLEVIDKKFPAEYYRRLKYANWSNYVSIEGAKAVHKQNIQKCEQAVEEHFSNTNIKILAVHGSSRSGASCAHERSNSQLLLKKGLEAASGDVEIEEVNLKDYDIEPCNNCYSTASALCNFPCTCFPLDPMQELYPKVLWCDILLLSTGVNQSSMSSRLKLFCDRLISLDGGYFIDEDQFVWKDSDFREKMIATSLKQTVQYDQRMQNRVAAFFISSKDEKDQKGDDEYGRPLRSYVENVAWSLYQGFYDYGMRFADPWYASFVANPEEELSIDKKRLSEDNDSHKKAQQVVREAVKKAKVIKKVPPNPRYHRPNRT